ncbi:MAG: amidohydrolase family protein [Acutalibacteraceae bacterium]|jgi:predicted TIM-barrel fold metal-dependent hydrolase
MVNGIYVIDAHCHIYPEKIAAKAVAGTDRFYGGKSVGTGTVGDLLERGAEAGIDRFIVQSVATTPKQVRSINDFIASQVSENPQRFIGFGTLHPDSEDINGDVEHLMELGLKGVKLHPDIQAFKIDDYRCLKIYEICEQKGLPILMHTGDYRFDYSNPNRLLPILDIYENLTVIGAHLGGWSVWDEACEKYAGKPKFYVDCSSSFSYLKPEKALEIIRRYGADRVLFGTDYPMWSPKAELEYFLALGLDEHEKECILNINAKKLLNLE